MTIGLVCCHVANQGLPVLVASHQHPEDPDDSGWVLACGKAGHADADWLVVDVTPYLQTAETASLLSLPCGATVAKESEAAPWYPAADG
jgi:hypothetical protein